MTRYPRAGRGRKWTILELKAIGPSWSGDTLSDGDGLSGEVRTARSGLVSVRFKYAFKWCGRITWHQCGTWPTSAMEVIRRTRDVARSQIRSGINPNDHKKVARLEAQANVEAVLAKAHSDAAGRLTLRDMFDAWIADGVARADGNKELRRAFEKDLLPRIGACEIRTLTDKHILDALRDVGRGRGRGRTAERMLSEVQQMFRWAERRKPWRALLLEGNPATLVDVDMVVPAAYRPVVRDRVLSPEELRELQSVFSAMERDYAAAPDRRAADRPVLKETQLAMWICLATACRIGELLQARWDNLDLDHGQWFVPAATTKTKVDWDVFLSEFAVAQFRALKELTGDSTWCFPARDRTQPIDAKTMSKQIGDRQMRFKERRALKGRRNDNSLVLAQGRFGAWTPHDLRRTAATMLQALGVAPDVIDRCQNHVLPGSKIRRHYLHYDYAREKREAWTRLGAEVDRVLAAVAPVSVRD